jgi:hypothetical protein
MAYSSTNRPPAGNANWRVFEPGDSVIKSVTRMAAIYECAQILVIAIAEFNAANTIALTQFEMGFDVDAGNMSASGAVPYQITVDTAGVETKKAVNYLGTYAGWTTPTTGELVDIDNPYDALVYLVRQNNRLNDAIRPNVLINDPKGLSTLNDNQTENQYDFTLSIPFTAEVQTDGSVSNLLQEYGIIADMQNGVLV